MKGPINKNDVQPVKMLEGVFRRTLVYNDTVMICHLTLEEGANIPLHNHEAHQIGHVMRGQLKFITEIGDFIAGEGDSYVFNAHEKHGAVCLELAEVVEVFSPTRDEYK